MLKNVTAPITAVNGSQELVILTDKAPSYEYADGQKGAQNGWKFTCLLVGNRLQALSVKVSGADPLPQVTDESLQEATAKRQYVYAKPQGCTVKLYTSNNSLGMTATATGISLVNSAKAAQ